MIRRYESDDCAAVVEVWYEAARVAHSFWTPEFFERERRNIIDRFLPMAETWVYEDNGAVVGFISLLESEVGGLFVTPGYQGRGIGRALIDHARTSRDRLELDVFEANGIGRAFYDAYGFRRVGERMDEETGRTVLRLTFP